MISWLDAITGFCLGTAITLMMITINLADKAKVIDVDSPKYATFKGEVYEMLPLPSEEKGGSK